MIKIIESPVYEPMYSISHVVSGETLTAQINDVTDSIDFSQFPDGKATILDVETTLPTNPFINIEKVDGVTMVEMIRFYGDDEKEVFEFGGNNPMEI